VTMNETNPVTPQPFIDALLGYQRTAALKAAIELGVFDAIGAHGADVETVCAKTNTSARGARILCDYLTVLGFLDKSGTIWRQTPVTATFIDSRSPTSMASVVRFLAGPEFVNLFLTDPAGYIRRGGTDGPGHTAPDDPIWVTFARSMTPFTVAAARATVTHVANWPTAPRRVLDIAAGAGMFGNCVAQAFPEALVVGVDSRDVIAIAAENAIREGVDARYRTIAGDAFTADLGTDYDLILLPNILHHFSHATCVTLLRRVRAGLAPHGRALIVEFIPDEDRINPPVPASFAFIMVAETQHGDAYTATEYAAMAQDAGLRAGLPLPLPPSQERLIELIV
jgi:2-polyprenyl-3-methyl-5-hydroxy-6-metoxy-1,4-benzoquinol methylase